MEWYTLGLRKDFLIHKSKTVESFRLVRADISGMGIHIEHLKNMLASAESRISAIGNQVLTLGRSIDKFSSDIQMQQSNNLIIQSKIDAINKSISSSIESVNSLNKGISGMLSRQQESSKRISSHDAAVKKLFSMSKAQSVKEKQLNSELKKSRMEAKKLRNFISQSLKKIDKKIIAKSSKAVKRKISSRKSAKTPKKRLVEVMKIKKPLI
ncbi:hypothetical protein HYX03_02985 [Candidatus Woesearchaeota archaeon]|nr:hypothetical protein [Candidatus Woesearchaeota archaeon]